MPRADRGGLSSRGDLPPGSTTLWRTLRIAWRLSQHEPFDVVHACNPPDLLFLIALALRPSGARFIFDHHDLVPELFESRLAGGRGYFTGFPPCSNASRSGLPTRH
jgi:hypothetical protein